MSGETWRVPRSGGYRGPINAKRYSGARPTCPYCSKPVSRTKDGALRVHGGVNRCDGSGRIA